MQKYDGEGFVLTGNAVNSIDNCVKICIYEGADKYDQFEERTQDIRDQIDEIVENGITVHGQHFPVKHLMGGDMSHQQSVYGHAGSSCSCFCMFCTQHKMEIGMTPFDYDRKGLPQPERVTILFANKLSHCYGEEWGLTEPYKCPGAGCGLMISSHGQHPPVDSVDGRRKFGNDHFGHRFLHPPINQTVEYIDRPGDNLHADIQIHPHVIWHTCHRQLVSAAQAQQVEELLELHSLHREVKYQGGKATPTKADLPHYDGPELETYTEKCRQPVMNLMYPDFTTDDALKAVILWQRFDEMKEAWSAEPDNHDLNELKAAAQAMRVAAHNFFEAFKDVAGASEVIPYMHQVWASP